MGEACCINPPEEQRAEGEAPISTLIWRKRANKKARGLTREGMPGVGWAGTPMRQEWSVPLGLPGRATG